MSMPFLESFVYNLACFSFITTEVVSHSKGKLTSAPKPTATPTISMMRFV